MDANQIIIEPVLTEKTNDMRTGSVKKYVFKVDPRANKIQIRDAVEKIFNVKTTKCSVVTVKAKPRTTRTKTKWIRGEKGSWKKAIVTLSEGDKINELEGA
ncbi:MAG: 50S ribosomal protein L23 [Spirochaetales bacterium]|nr:50S ribosomal protein L23 [Spirochaetales bacterium]